jgi:hypothetical protein
MSNCSSPLLTLAVMMMTLPAMSGCASIDGGAKPVIPLVRILQIADKYDIDKSLSEIATIAGDHDKQVYRNRVIAINMSAIDARYMEFRTNLSRQIKGGNFGLDTAILGLTGVGALAGKTAANILSASAAGLTGTKSALSKDVYFERTLPVLLTSLETRRLKIATEIVKRMRNENADGYTLDEAFLDLNRYQMASSLDGALEQLSSDASVQHNAEQRKYNVIFEACEPDDATTALWPEISTALNGLDITKLHAVADFTGAAKSDDADTQRESVRDMLNSKYCTAAAAQSLRDKIAQTNGGGS